MSDWTALVVCEGSSDLALIEAVVAHAGRLRGKSFRVKELKRERDATSGGFETFGWKEVRRWCLRQRHLKQSSGRDEIGQYLALAPADCLLIHLDTDIAEEIHQRDGFAVCPPADRNAHCRHAVGQWLGVHAHKPEIRLILPTHQIETWLLATYDSSPLTPAFGPAEYEAIHNVEAHLLGLGYDEDREKPGRLYKQHALYKDDDRYGPRLCRHLALAAERCPELFRFHAHLATV